MIVQSRYPYNAFRLDTDSRFPNFGFPSVTNANLLYGTGEDIKGDAKNPNWKLEIAKQLDATTNHRRTSNFAKPARIEIISENRAAYPSYTTRSQYSANTLGYTDTLVEPEDLVIRDLALIKLKRRMASHMDNFNAIAPAVELKQLRQLIRGSAGLSESFVRGLIKIRNDLKLQVPVRKRRGKGYTYTSAAPTFMEQMSDAWLTFSFGISPTIADINNVALAISDYMFDRDELYRERASQSKIWATSGVATASGSAHANLVYNYRMEHKLTYAFGAGTSLQVTAANPYDLPEKFGLTFGDIIPAFWELTPYSWLFDYFGTIGAFLEDEFSVPAGSSVFVYETKRYTRSVITDISFTELPPEHLLEHKVVGTSIQNYSGYTRTKLLGLPHRLLRFKTLDEIGRNSINRLLNLTSLLIKR